MSDNQLNSYRASDDSWWSMTDEYFKLLATYKKRFADLYLSKDGLGLLSVVELEWLHVKSNFQDEKYKDKVDLINEELKLVRALFNQKTMSGSKSIESFEINNNKAIVKLLLIAEKLYLLENDKGMLQRKPENMMENLRKYGD